MAIIKGNAVSPGIAIGTVLIFNEQPVTIRKLKLADDDVTEELASFDAAIGLSRRQLKTIHDKTKEKMGADKAAIFKAHQEILMDPALFDSVKEKITVQHQNAVWAFNDAILEFCAMFEST